MKPRLFLLVSSLALFAAWFGGFHGMSWPDGHLFF
jgi:hypothetical protein